jgi:hypothetical protein
MRPLIVCFWGPKHDEIDDQCILECKSSLLKHIQSDDIHPADPFHKPTSLGGMKYNLVPWDSSADGDRLNILTKLEAANPVVLRGVNCLVKARMAFQHGEFAEAACIYLWIALDAAHSLILKKLRLSCALDILLLRREQPGRIVLQSGDIDNRVKTLFDGLRMPASADEAGAIDPTANPFFCLLESDTLIDEVHVVTDMLLIPADKPEKQNHVRIIISVESKTTTPISHTSSST